MNAIRVYLQRDRSCHWFTMTYYYVHDESGCALMSDDPPRVVMSGDPCVELVDRKTYLRACDEYGQTPEAHPDPCPETRRRIRVAVAAWAYEVHSDPIMTDAEFDELAKSIDVDRSTLHSDLDKWFVANFTPDTGMWVHNHPEPEGLERIYQMLRRSTVRQALSMDLGTMMQWVSAA